MTDGGLAVYIYLYKLDINLWLASKSGKISVLLDEYPSYSPLSFLNMVHVVTVRDENEIIRTVFNVGSFINAARLASQATF